MPGEKLIGLRYVPPFDFYYKMSWRKKGQTLRRNGDDARAYRLARRCRPISSRSIPVSGIVHQAPAFGEVDFDLLQSEQARFVEGEGP